MCIVATLGGCVSLSYYESLREAYEKSETRNEALKHDANRLRAELAQVQKQLADRVAVGKAEPDLVREKAEILKRLETTLGQLSAGEQEKARLAQRLEETKTALAAKEQEMNQALRALKSSLSEEIAKGSSTVQRQENTVNVMLAERILYESGSAHITPAGKKVLQRIAEALRASPNTDIRVEGHTDDVPIRTDPPPRFSSNFELSFARAVGVARYFNEVAEVKPSRLSAMGLASTRPLVENVDDEARARNRRVEIIVMPSR
jgi:chemotaxis protein MotB